MSRPFNFRINAAELFTEIQALNMEQKALFITQFSTDLLTLCGTSDYSKKVISETLQLIEKRSESGKLGGRPKSKTKAKVNQRLSEGEAKPKQSQSNKEKEKEKIMHDFELFWDAFNYKKGKGGAESSWVSILNYSDDLLKKILDGARREAINRPALLARNSTPKMAQGWLTERRWEDESTAPLMKTIQNADGDFIQVPA